MAEKMATRILQSKCVPHLGRKNRLQICNPREKERLCALAYLRRKTLETNEHMNVSHSTVVHIYVQSADTNLGSAGVHKNR